MGEDANGLPIVVDELYRHTNRGTTGIVGEVDDTVGQARFKGDTRWWNSHNLERVDEDDRLTVQEIVHQLSSDPVLQREMLHPGFHYTIRQAHTAETEWDAVRWLIAGLATWVHEIEGWEDDE